MTIHALAIAQFADRVKMPLETVRSMQRRGQLPEPDVEIGTGTDRPVRGWLAATVDAWAMGRRSTPTDEEIVDTFIAFVTERATTGGGVAVAKAVAEVAFDDGAVRVVLNPALAGAEYSALIELAAHRENLADFFGVPAAFDDEDGIWLRTRVQSVDVRDIDGRPLGSRTTEELTRATRGE